MEELGRLDPTATKGRIILAHLGNGASLAAVRDGKSVDTSMGFTPTSGLMMSTRTGDLDPGLVYYSGAHRAHDRQAISANGPHESGLRSVSGTSSDMRDLLAREPHDGRAADAVDAILLSGEEVDRLLRRGARRIGHARLRRRHRRNAPLVRTRICDGLSFLGIGLNESQRADCEHDFHGRQSLHGSRHSFGRGTDDCAFGAAVVQPRYFNEHRIENHERGGISLIDR